MCQRSNTQELQAASNTVTSHGTEINPGSAASGLKDTQHEPAPEVPPEDVQYWG